VLIKLRRILETVCRGTNLCTGWSKIMRFKFGWFFIYSCCEKAEKQNLKITNISDYLFCSFSTMYLNQRTTNSDTYFNENPWDAGKEVV
jgi:hypothetical protein